MIFLRLFLRGSRRRFGASTESFMISPLSLPARSSGSDIGEASIDDCSISSPVGLPSPAKIGDQHHDKVNDEPDIVVPEILINVDQYQNSGHKDPENQIGPLGHRIMRVRPWREQQTK